MGTVDQPKPTQPKAPQPEQSPLQPGNVPSRPTNEADPNRTNTQTPERSEERIHGEE